MGARSLERIINKAVTSSPLRRRVVIFVGTLCVMAMAACPQSGDGSEGQGEDAGSSPTVIGPEVSKACVETDDCPGQVCDKHYGGCVDCYLNVHCADDHVCMSGQCVPMADCGVDADCAPGVCGPDGTCVECVVDSDCVEGRLCVDHVCRPPLPACEDSLDCQAIGAVCLEDEGVCVTCTDQSQCGEHEYCSEGECVPQTCIPSDALCNGKAIMICRDDGLGWSQVLCPEGETCFAGTCINDDCEPNTTTCEKYQLMQCTPTGQIITTNCSVGQECIDDDCKTMRHRVLVIFDTSGSMDHFPGTGIWPQMCGDGEVEDCYQPYPSCEDPEAPISILGHSKAVFGEFFDQEDGVVFGLQRFPQVADMPAPSCNGGYFNGATTVSGDDGAMSLSLHHTTWFDQALDEILLVPFPNSVQSSNVSDLSEWMDFHEWVVDTGTPCTTVGQCETGVCLGPVGSQTCRIFANPELWADGWTPLGRSLFYAGEYLRKYVIIDGKPCAKDADCDSPGYYCGETGQCFDPLRDCRLNVIVLFTDGGETEHPFTNDYFNPQVQAKRLRFGLGCDTDADCSQVEYCERNEENISWYGCHPIYCDKPEGALRGSCTHAMIEGISPEKITYSAPGFDRLRDYNDNPIDVIVNVVDASVVDPEATSGILDNNGLIALNGGGLHVIVNAGDAPDFLAQLQKTIDFKSLFELCVE